jgi:hypothetical protein
LRGPIWIGERGSVDPEEQVHPPDLDVPVNDERSGADLTRFLPSPPAIDATHRDHGDK